MIIITIKTLMIVKLKEGKCYQIAKDGMVMGFALPSALNRRHTSRCGNNCTRGRLDFVLKDRTMACSRADEDAFEYGTKLWIPGCIDERIQAWIEERQCYERTLQWTPEVAPSNETHVCTEVDNPRWCPANDKHDYDNEHHLEDASAGCKVIWWLGGDGSFG